MVKVTLENCNVCSENCDGACQSKCFRCGLPVCIGCSNRIIYLHYGRKRICLYCTDEMESQ